MAGRVTQQSETPEQEENQVTRPSDLGFGPSREIEVERVRDVRPQTPDDQGFVEIRMNTTIEEFTYGNPHQHFHLERGKVYRVPRHIAAYLDSLEYVWH